MILVDSDVPIDVLRREETAVSLLAAVQVRDEFGISIVSRIETIRGCLNREVQQRAEKFLHRFAVIGLDAHISQQADALVTRYFLSHRLAVPDALIAATALEYRLPLLPKNQRHYRFIAGLSLLPYPSAPA